MPESPSTRTPPPPARPLDRRADPAPGRRPWSRLRRLSRRVVEHLSGHAPVPDLEWQDLVALELGEPLPAPPRAPARDACPPRRQMLRCPPRDLFGLALSGGGIRSATFNLGLLQGLDSLRLLRHFDYLATVSGGGYVGGFWSAWRRRREARPHAPVDASMFPEARDGEVEPREIRHLREFSNFLSPRLGVLSYDTGRMLVSAVAGFVPAFSAALATIALGLAGWLAVAALLFLGGAPGALDGLTRTLSLGAPWPARLALWVPPLAIAAVTVVALGLFETQWRRRNEVTNRVVYGGTTILAAVLAAGLWLAGTTVGPVVAPFGPRQVVPIVATTSALNEANVPRWLHLLAPAAAWALAVVLLVVLRATVSRWVVKTEHREWREVYDRVAGRVLFLAAAWTTASVVWYAGVLLLRLVTSGTAGAATATGLSGLVAVLGVAFGRAQRWIAEQPNRGVGQAMLARLRPRLPQLLAYLILAALFAAVAATLAAAARAGVLEEVTLLAAAIVVLTLVFFDANEVGLHGFYRARLARAYLGASNPEGGRRTEEQRGDDLPLVELSSLRPLHLVCCAANDLSSRDPLGELHRGAVSAVLSPVGVTVGDAAASWQRWREERRGQYTLATAMTASAAAFNSQMGSKSAELGPAVTFLMTALNLRLGLWMPHPRHVQQARRHAHRLHGLAFFEELFGRSSADGDRVHLSDGGHFENMAIYELVRRHCRFILASDCGADPDVAFDDFGNLVRRVREDFGVDVDIDLSPLEPDERGIARQPMVAGDIRYPDGDMGVLLLVKPTLVGTEPADVAQYHTRNAAFPHESTGDQFYDEAQWESYRRLGVHAARSAFYSVVGRQDLELDARTRAAQLFARARKQWQPIPAGYDRRASQLASRAAELDALLFDPSTGHLPQTVYRELDAVSRAAGRDGAAAALVPPSPEELGQSLAAVRHAMLFMEETFLCEELGRRHDHPAYLGLVNYFLRWTYAPHFRFWWPLTRAMHGEPFVRYLESRFDLASESAAARGRALVRVRRPRVDEFAMYCRTVESGPPAPGDRFLCYDLPLAWGLAVAHELQAAQLRFRIAGREVVLWDAEDFYVPPGLWGVGVGEDFLRRIVAGGAPGDASHLLVRLRAQRAATMAARRDHGYLSQLYRSQGFREIWPEGSGLRVGTISVPETVLPREEGWTYQWLTRRVERGL